MHTDNVSNYWLMTIAVMNNAYYNCAVKNDTHLLKMSTSLLVIRDSRY